LTATEGASLFAGEVDITEALGEVTLLYFKAQGGDEPVIAKLPGVHRDLRGRPVSVTAEPDKVHLFADGASLRP
jgi:alpha-glucoside transport system ATP-binding protein